MKHPLFMFIAQTYFCCSVTKLCPILCVPMNCSTQGFPVLHYLPEFVQTRVHWVSDTIQLPHFHCPLLLLPSIFPIIRLFSNESASLIAQLVKNPLQCRTPQFDSWVGKIHWRKDSLPTSVFWGFPGGSAGKKPTCHVGDMGLIPGLGRSLGEGKGYPLCYSSLENSMHCIVRGVPKGQTGLRNLYFTWIRWPKYWSFSYSPSSEYSGLISFRNDWFDLLAVQRTLKSLSTTIWKHQFFGFCWWFRW